MSDEPASTDSLGFDPPQAAVAPGARLGPYEIEALLGAGGMGQVYRARDTRLGRPVAIKICGERFEGRFAREARAISSLNHPHICTLYDVGPNYLVMELVEGETLAARLGRGPLAADAAMRFAVQIGEALVAAHAKGIVHRDLKPGNIMLTKAGVKVLDFGLAKFADAAKSSGEPLSTLTIGRGIMGTLPYMAPEQLEGNDCDQRTDIFALGLVVFEMATGRRARGGATQAALIANVMRSEMPAIEGIPAALARVIRGCLARDPEERWQSAREFQLALRFTAEASEPSQAAPKPAREWWAWSAAAVLGLAAVLLAIGRYAGHAGGGEPISLQILPPEGGAFNSPTQPDREIMAISPDGRAVAFSATVEGETLLWIREIGQLTPHPLPGTESAYAPFWSPDSRSLAFFADGKLKRIDPAGGPPQVIAEVSPTAGTGTWGSGGDILFSDTHAERSIIYRVRAEGGDVSTVTAPTARQQFWPQFLPDGKRFLYMVLAPGAHETLAASLDGGEPTPIAREFSHAAYAPPGYLLFVREGALMAQRFDVDALRLEGTPVPIVEQMDYFQPTGLAPFSVSANGTLAYQGAGSSSQLLWLDRNGRQISEIGEPGAYLAPSLSPDGRKLAVAATDRRTGTNDIDVFDLTRPESPQRFTSMAGDEFTPVWSPDGNRILLSWDNGKVPHLHQKGLDESSEPREVLPASGGVQEALAWLPDGSILYQDIFPDTKTDILLLPPGEGRQPRKLLASRFIERDGAISPDGAWLAYVHDESGRWEVYVRSFPQLGAPVKISNRGGRWPKWARDGAELYFIEGDRLMAVPVRTGAEFGAGAPATVFQVSSGIVDYDVGADGRFLVNVGRVGYLIAPISVIVNWTAVLPR